MAEADGTVAVVRAIVAVAVGVVFLVHAHVVFVVPIACVPLPHTLDIDVHHHALDIDVLIEKLVPLASLSLVLLASLSLVND